MLGQLLLDLFRPGIRLVDLVDRHDDRHAGRLGVVDRLSGLGHHAVVGGHHQNNDIGHLGAPGPHGGKGFVTRRIQEGDLAAMQLHIIGADMLGDAAGLAGNDVGLTDGIQAARSYRGRRDP